MTRWLLCLLAALLALPAWAAPTIGVSGQRPDSPSVIALMSLLRVSGATPVFLGDHAKRHPADDIASLDGVIVAGNNYDVDPAVYGAAAAPETVNEMHKGKAARARAAYEYAIIELALQRKLPLLGICGGMQRMNVGGDKNAQGTLVQHVPDNNQWHKGVPLFEPSDPIRLVPESHLAAIAQGQLHWQENSLHHQAPDRIRRGFRIAAYNKDGLIEAIEPDPTGAYAGQFALGVQWHPEYGASELGSKIFGAFLEAAAQ